MIEILLAAIITIGGGFFLLTIAFTIIKRGKDERNK